jgi:hypothetical protein
LLSQQSVLRDELQAARKPRTLASMVRWQRHDGGGPLFLVALVACGGDASRPALSPAELGRRDASCVVDNDPDACIAAGDARAGSRITDELARAATEYEKACDLRPAACSHFRDFADRLEQSCWNEHDAISCYAAGDARKDAPKAFVDLARSRALFEKACEIGIGMCGSFLPTNRIQWLGMRELACIDGRLMAGDCFQLRLTLEQEFGIQRNQDDWLPFLAEAAQGTLNYETCAIDPASCPRGPVPTIPSPDQAVVQQKRILDGHDARCRAGVVAECEARVRINALRLALNLSREGMGWWQHPYDPRAEWDGLCRAGSRTSCLDLGLINGDEAALRRACELGDSFGCTRAAGAMLARRDPAGARPWLDRACRMGRAWACR